MYCIFESTFAGIFLFLELPFQQDAQFYRENLFPHTSNQNEMSAKDGEHFVAILRFLFLSAALF